MSNSSTKPPIIQSIYHDLYEGERILQQINPSPIQYTISSPPTLPPSSSIKILEADKKFLHTKSPTVLIREDSSTSLLNKNDNILPSSCDYEPNINSLSTIKPTPSVSLYHSDRFKSSNNNNNENIIGKKPKNISSKIKIELVSNNNSDDEDHHHDHHDHHDHHGYQYKINEIVEEIYEQEIIIPTKSFSFSKAPRFNYPKDNSSKLIEKNKIKDNNKLKNNNNTSTSSDNIEDDCLFDIFDKKKDNQEGQNNQNNQGNEIEKIDKEVTSNQEDCDDDYMDDYEPEDDEMNIVNQISNNEKEEKNIIQDLNNDVNKENHDVDIEATEINDNNNDNNNYESDTSDPFILTREDLVGKEEDEVEEQKECKNNHKFDPKLIEISDDDSDDNTSNNNIKNNNIKKYNKFNNYLINNNTKIDRLAYRIRTDIGIVSMKQPQEKKIDQKYEDRKRLEYLLDDLLGPGEGNLFPVKERSQEDIENRRGPGSYNVYKSCFDEIKGGKFSKSKKINEKIIKNDEKLIKKDEEVKKNIFELVDEVINEDKIKKQKNKLKNQNIDSKTSNNNLKNKKIDSKITKNNSKITKIDSKNKKIDSKTTKNEENKQNILKNQNLSLMERFKLAKKEYVIEKDKIEKEKLKEKQELEEIRKRKSEENQKKLEEINRKKKIKLELEANKPNPLSYHINYNQVERNATNRAPMVASTKARESTKNLLEKNPKVKEILKEKELEGNPQRFYGPQLHTPWVPDKESMKKEENDVKSIIKLKQDLIKKNKNLENNEKIWYDFLLNDEENEEIEVERRNRIETEEESEIEMREKDDEEIEEVLEFLIDKQNNRKKKTTDNTLDIYTEAYLQSRYTGTIYKKDIQYFKNEESNEKLEAKDRKKKLEEQYYQNLDPELLNYERNEYDFRRFQPSNIDFSKGVGRAKVKVTKKDQVEIIDFLSPRVFEEDTSMGPGQYNIEDAYQNQEKKVSAVIFDKQVGREDRFSTNLLRRPEEGNELEDILETEFGIGGKLDLDPLQARDYIKKSNRGKDIQLYRKDRFEEPKKKKKEGEEEEEEEEFVIEDDWFEKQLKRERELNNKVPDWSKQLERDALGLEKKKLKDELYAREIVEELGLDTAIAGITSHNIDLKEKELKKPTYGEFSEVTKYPRFEENVEKDEIKNKKFIENQEKIKYMKSKKWLEYIKENKVPLPEEVEENYWEKLKDKNQNLEKEEENDWILSKGYLNMEKMSGRTENNIENIIQEEVYGVIDTELAKEYVQEKDLKRRVGQDVLLKKEIRGENAVVFDKQISRETAKRKEKDLNLEEQLEEDIFINQLAGIDGKMVKVREQKEDNYWKDNIKNAVDMSKNLKSDENFSMKNYSDNYVNMEKVELDLNPVDIKKKKVQKVLEWKKISTTNNIKLLEEEGMELEKREGEVLDLDLNINLHKIRKNYKEDISVNMKQDQGRVEKEKEREKRILNEDLEREFGINYESELELEIDRQVIEKRPKGGAVAYQTGLKNKKLDGTSWASDILNDYEGDQLIISPKDLKDPLLDTSNNKKGAVSIFKSSSPSRANAKTEKAIESLIAIGEMNPFNTTKYEGQVLELETENKKENITKQSSKVVKKPSSSSSSNSNNINEPVKEGGGIKNIVSFRNTEKNLPTKAEAKAEADFNTELAKLNYFNENQSKSYKKSAKNASPPRKEKNKTKREISYPEEDFEPLSPYHFDGFDDINGIAPSKDHGEKYKSFEAKLAKLSL